eukprot:1161555-Pelagomonas_calceolata.AAC.13
MAAAVQPLWRDLMAQGCHRMRALPSPQNACIAFATDCMHDLAIECMLDLFLQRAWKAVVLLPVGAGTLCLAQGCAAPNNAALYASLLQYKGVQPLWRDLSASVLQQKGRRASRIWPLSASFPQHKGVQPQESEPCMLACRSTRACSPYGVT